MEEVLQALIGKFPLAAALYMGLSGAYMVFCAIAAITKSDKDDKIRDTLRRFFSLPIPK